MKIESWGWVFLWIIPLLMMRKHELSILLSSRFFCTGRRPSLVVVPLGGISVDSINTIGQHGGKSPLGGISVVPHDPDTDREGTGDLPEVVAARLQRWFAESSRRR